MAAVACALVNREAFVDFGWALPVAGNLREQLSTASGALIRGTKTES